MDKKLNGRTPKNCVRHYATKTPAWQHITAAPSVIFLRVNAQMLNLDLAKKRTLSRNRYHQLLMTRILIILFILTIAFSCSQNPTRTIRDTTFKVNDLIAFPIPTFCLGRGCPDGITLDTYDSLTNVATFIKKHPQFIFQIETNTDQRGDAANNKTLSDNRATFLRKILITKNGVDSTSLFAKGLGETNPIFSQKQIDVLKTMEEKENLYSQNRRTVLRIVGQK